MSAHEGLEAVLRGEADFAINMLSGRSAEIDFTPPVNEPFVLACGATIHWPISHKWLGVSSATTA